MVLRKLLSLLRYVYLAIVVALLFASLTFAIMQTKWAKAKVASVFSTLCQQRGIQVRMGRLEGIFPFTWQIENMVMQWEDNRLELDNIKMRFAILPFINKTVVLSYFNVEKAHLAFSENPPQFQAKELFDRFILPYRIVVQRVKINTLICENKSRHAEGQYLLVADADLGKQMRHLHAHLSLNPKGHLDNALHASLTANAKLNQVAFGIKANLPSLTALSPFYPFSPEESVDLDLSLKGKWTSWHAWLNEKPLPSPILGTCSGQVHIKALPLHSWKIEAAFGIDSYDSLEVYSSTLRNEVVHISMDGKIEKELENSAAHLQFSLPSLRLLDPNLKGAVLGEATYANSCAQLDLHTQDLTYKGYAIEPLAVHAVVHRKDDEWSGRTDVCSEKSTCGFDFQYKSHFLALNGFSLERPGVLLAGDLALDTKRTLFTGALYGHIDHLRSLFPDMDASVGIECQLFEEEGQSQGLRCFLLGKNSHFKQYTIDQWSLTASVSDVFSQPLGRLHLLAKDVHSPMFDIDFFDLTTVSEEEEEWPFSLTLEGTSEDTPLSLYAQGYWKKEGPLLSVETTTIAGTAFSSQIQLLEPFLFEVGKDQATLSPLHMTIGKGSIFANFDLHPKRSTAEMQLEHFPLKLFSLGFPSHTLTGTLNLNAQFDATADNMEGTLNVVLEEASLPHFEEVEPFIAKGSLQAHLDNRVLQTHAYLHATKEQFIDLSATLPIGYQVYPWRLCLDTQAPVSAELIAEGRLQDLFDFINLGIHRASGFLSSRVFLSGSLSAPSMIGSIEWQEGTYENFLTGTSLRNINAQLNADRNALKLLSFSATDDKKGTVSAEGTIDLNFQEHIPYRFVAELDHLHALHFNPIDCTLSGPLYLSGNLHEALAQGNLLISQAEFTIPDKLPVEVPVLPVTYVNGTYPLSSAALQSSPAFAFRIQLDLTADDQVLVKGKGLNSEWKGMLSLSGSNMNVLANGTLQLIKGEYSLLGKTFKLNEGQIIFNDKPTPSATINLTGNLSLADTVITAHLRGPLSSPTLTFQSNPQLSTSAILARILFNKDITDISQPEAIQLATTLISLSGGAGPSVLEAIRKNIGVDRLAISSQTAHPDEIAVQIGKYLTKGVLITLSQSATSSQVIVEVEFNYGFVFQAETQEEQEGKFSLKWTHSY